MTSDKTKRWTAVYYRYQVRYEDPEPSFEEAVLTLAQGENSGDISARAIIRPDGSEVPSGEMWAAIQSEIEDMAT